MFVKEGHAVKLLSAVCAAKHLGLYDHRRRGLVVIAAAAAVTVEVRFNERRGGGGGAVAVRRLGKLFRSRAGRK